MALFKASTPLFFGMLAMTLAAAPGMAQGHGNRGGGDRTPSRGTTGGGQSSDRNRSAGNSRGNQGPGFSGGNRGSGYRGGQQFGGGRDRERGERREFRGGSGYYGGYYGGYGGYRRSGYGGYYSGGGIYLGFGLPYYDSYYDPYYSPRYAYDGYGYDRGYGYDPGYEYGPDRGSSYGPTYAPSPCTVDAYDQYGRRIPNPNCNSSQPQYPPQGSYNDNSRQYQQYPQQQPNQNYDRR